LVAKSEWNRPLGRRRCRWENIIRTNAREIGWKGVDWIHLAQDRERERPVTGFCEHGDEPSVSTKGGEFLD
jgi:hypothetical protein